MKKQTGITLIALVITIIVLLILAGVSISMIIGENGILTNAMKAKMETDMKSLKEQAELIKMNEQIILSSNGSSTPLAKEALAYAIKKGINDTSLTRNIVTAKVGESLYDIIVDDETNITVVPHGETILGDGYLDISFSQGFGKVKVYFSAGNMTIVSKEEYDARIAERASKEGISETYAAEYMLMDLMGFEGTREQAIDALAAKFGLDVGNSQTVKYYGMQIYITTQMKMSSYDKAIKQFVYNEYSKGRVLALLPNGSYFKDTTYLELEGNTTATTDFYYSEPGNYTFTLIGPNGEKETRTIALTNYSIKMGDFVDYGVEYNDPLSEHITFKDHSYWRILDGVVNPDGTISNLKIVSTGMPIAFNYNSTTEENTSWWVKDETKLAEFRQNIIGNDMPVDTEVGYDKYSAMQAAAGLYYNLGELELASNKTSSKNNLGYYTKIISKGTQYNSLTARKTLTANELFNTDGVNRTLTTITFRDIYDKIKYEGISCTGGNGYITSEMDPTGVFKLDCMGTNILSHSYQYGQYYIASPLLMESGYSDNLMFVNGNGDVQSTPGSDSWPMGIRPVISFNYDVKLEKNDNHYKIKSVELSGKQIKNAYEHGEIKYGDYINYNEGKGYTHTPDTEKGAGTSVTATNHSTRHTLATSKVTTEDLKWRVLGVNEKGELELISADPTTQVLYLANDIGYINAEDNLNNFCNDLYGKGQYATMARSLNVEDIIKLNSHNNVNSFMNLPNSKHYIVRYPTTDEVSGTRYLQYSENEGKTWININSGPQSFRLPEESKAICSTNPGTVEFYTKGITGNLYYPSGWNIEENTIMGNFISKGTGNTNITQWLASKNISTGSFWGNFAVQTVNSGSVDRYRLFGSDDWYDSAGFRIRPVVTLSSDITLSGSGNDLGSATNMWKISN